MDAVNGARPACGRASCQRAVRRLCCPSREVASKPTRSESPFFGPGGHLFGLRERRGGRGERALRAPFTPSGRPRPGPRAGGLRHAAAHLGGMGPGGSPGSRRGPRGGDDRQGRSRRRSGPTPGCSRHTRGAAAGDSGRREGPRPGLGFVSRFAVVGPFDNEGKGGFGRASGRRRTSRPRSTRRRPTTARSARFAGAWCPTCRRTPGSTSASSCGRRRARARTPRPSCGARATGKAAGRAARSRSGPPAPAP